MVETRRRNRNEILELATVMARELEARAAQPGASLGEMEAYRRSAKYLKELLSIASGQRSSAYWIRRRKDRPLPSAAPTAAPLMLEARRRLAAQRISVA